MYVCVSVLITFSEWIVAGPAMNNLAIKANGGFITDDIHRSFVCMYVCTVCMYVCMYECILKCILLFYFRFRYCMYVCIYIVYMCLGIFWLDGNKFMYVCIYNECIYENTLCMYVCMYVCMSVCRMCLNYVASSVEMSPTYKVLKPHIDFLLFQVVFPTLCITEKDIM